MMPIIEKISRIRDVFFSRTPKDDSMTPPPFESIRNWNSADEFMDGAWTAYNEAIRAILLSADKEAPLPAALFTPEVELPILHFTELPETWRFQGRFTAIAGPRSLEGLHEMTSDLRRCRFGYEGLWLATKRLDEGADKRCPSPFRAT